MGQRALAVLLERVMSGRFTRRVLFGARSHLGVRSAQGGGLTAVGRAAREWVRLQAVERFEREDKNREIAAALRVRRHFTW